MGTGDIAIPSFMPLLGKGLLALVTQPDKPVGRKQVLTPPRIKEIAIEHGIAVMQPERAGSAAFLDELEALNPDIIVVMAYGQILSQRLIGGSLRNSGVQHVRGRWSHTTMAAACGLGQRLQPLEHDIQIGFRFETN